MKIGTNIFISYSHVDTPFFDELKNHLSALRREKLIVINDDQSLRSGDVLNKEIRKMIIDSEVFLALISQNYFTSNYCFIKEYEFAMKNKKIIIPIILEHCDWTAVSKVKKFAACPKDGKPVRDFIDRNMAYTEISVSINKKVQDFRDASKIANRKTFESNQSSDNIAPTRQRNNSTIILPTTSTTSAVSTSINILQMKKKQSGGPVVLRQHNSNRKKSIPVQVDSLPIYLPVNNQVLVSEQFLAATGVFFIAVAEFNIMLNSTVKDINTKCKNSLFDLETKYGDRRNWSEETKRLENSVRRDTWQSFFIALCKYCAEYLLDCYAVRVHLRYYDINKKQFRKFYAVYEEKDYTEDMDPIKYGEGLIKIATDERRSILKSLNSVNAVKTQNNAKYKDFLTLVFPEFFVHNAPVFTMGFSVEKNDAKTKERLILLNYYKIETIIQMHIKTFEDLTKINMRRIFLDYTENKK